MKLDFLMINPCANLHAERERRARVNVEEKIQRQQPPHLGAGYLLAMADRNNISADYIDMAAYEVTIEDLIAFIKDTDPLIIGLTAFTVQIKSAGYVAVKIKESFPYKLVGIGGPHATAIPHETLKEFPAFDFAVCGEGDDLLPQIINNLDDPSVVPGIVTSKFNKPFNSRIDDLDTLPFPAWEKFDLSKYPGSDPHRTARELPLSTSRGCPFSCNFCARMFGRKRIAHSVDYVLAEMERNIKDFGAQAFSIMDETFIADIEWNEKLFTAMINKGINKKVKWSCSTRVDIVTPDIFKLMRKAGCYYVFFGFEHGDDEMLRIMEKRVNVNQTRQTVGWAKDAGIVVAGSFILGLPRETLETARTNMNFAKSLDIYSTSFPIACPYPGTLLRDQAKRHDYGLKILTDDWDDYGKQYPGVMESDVLSIHQLRDLQKEAYELNPKKNIDDFEKINTYE